VSPKILVFGRTGQVATELQRAARSAQIDLTALPRSAADLSTPDACAALIGQTDADVIINAAAYTAVDAAEQDEATAMLVNGTAPGAMAQAAAARGLPFLHISTDYVFDGSGDVAWAEHMPTNPLGAYGRSKLAGEQAIIAVGGPYVILRTSWVFSAHGSNFVKTMRRIGQDRDSLNVVNDQYGGPTPAADIASTLLRIAGRFFAGDSIPGVFHYAGTPAISWAGFANRIFAANPERKGPKVHGIPSSEYPTPAKRPANSVLNCSKIKELYDISQPDWVSGLKDVIRELETKK
jgi:dTDP-4-dehydrorhamnose reductase